MDRKIFEPSDDPSYTTLSCAEFTVPWLYITEIHIIRLQYGHLGLPKQHSEPPKRERDTSTGIMLTAPYKPDSSSIPFPPPRGYYLRDSVCGLFQLSTKQFSVSIFLDNILLRHQDLNLRHF